jgi:hypothetical protein
MYICVSFWGIIRRPGAWRSGTGVQLMNMQLRFPSWAATGSRSFPIYRVQTDQVFMGNHDVTTLDSGAVVEYLGLEI